MWFEQFGGHSKGRGFTADPKFSPFTRGRQHPLYPPPPLALACMAYVLVALHVHGGFDEAVGAGMLVEVGKAQTFTDLLRAGGTVGVLAFGRNG